MKQIWPALQQRPWWQLMLLALLLRLALAPVNGHHAYNFDFRCFWEAGNLVADGLNPYLHTPRLNYGPLSAWLEGGLVLLARQTPWPVHSFRLLLVLIFAGADLALAAQLRRRWGRAAALLFLLSPLAVLTSGFHGQWDIAAISLGLAAVLLLARGPGRAGLWGTILLLGLSLALKHTLLLLPLWLALRPGQHLGRRIRLLLGPLAVVAASFLPYALTAAGRDAIWHNVVLYSSFHNAPLYQWLPQAAHLPLFLGVMAAGGWAWRRCLPADAWAAYAVLLLLATPSLAVQYFVIGLVGIATVRGQGHSPSGPVWLYGLLGSLLLVLFHFWPFFDARLAWDVARLYHASQPWLLLGLQGLLLWGAWPLARRLH